jgi:hypothetical protein
LGYVLADRVTADLAAALVLFAAYIVEITRELALSRSATWNLALPLHRRLAMGNSIKGSNKQHETKTDI